MDKAQFIERMSKKFKADDSGMIQLEDIMAWTTKENIEDYAYLYNQISERYKYKTMPSLHDVKEFYHAGASSTKSTFSYVDEILTATKKHNAMTICRKLAEIHAQYNVDGWKLLFIHTYSDLWHIYQHMNELGKIDADELEKAKNFIASGYPVICPYCDDDRKVVMDDTRRVGGEVNIGKVV